ncbi:MAG: hypothetical protein COS37_00825 [Anaerolineae bacterium CG03_land_8_20_14_0_80_58_20]|nr:MAG: hypothetical protein COS37_00825 [Anaerolineae bacterium CG03_land_8_20_14_0_80_58_20]
MSDVEIGKITHYFDHINVAVLTLTGPLKVGDAIHIHGHSTDFTQTVASMQIEHQPVQSAKQGDDVALKVDQKAHPHDKVFKVE